MTHLDDSQQDEDRRDGEDGAENDQARDADTLPGKPEGDKNAEAGSTDQHSSADA